MGYAKYQMNLNSLDHIQIVWRHNLLVSYPISHLRVRVPNGHTKIPHLSLLPMGIPKS